RVGCLENKVDFVGRQLAQAQEIFACPARGHDPNVDCWDSETRGAYACTVQVSMFRRNKLLIGFALVCRSSELSRKVRESETPSPARCKRALPTNVVSVFIPFPSRQRPVLCHFPAAAPESVRAWRSANFSRRNRVESAARDGRDRPVLRAVCARGGRMN